MKYTTKDSLPCPRLELVWKKQFYDYYGDGKPEFRGIWMCYYNLVLPLDDLDCRGNVEGGPRETELKVELGWTKVDGGGEDSPFDFDGNVSGPRRASVHIQIDNMSLGGHLPMIGICEDKMNDLKKCEHLWKNFQKGEEK